MILLLSAVCVRADIIEWRDAHGVRHYTNLREEIPAAHRDAAQVVIDEKVRRAPEPLPAESIRDQAAEPPRQAQVVYDRAVVVDAYSAGLERGMELARGGEVAVQGGSVQIHGPLAIAHAPAAPAVVYPHPYAYPWVTSSFDRGRSRHLTLRMLMQDQFLLDREGPYAFAGYVPPPVVPYLSRGGPCRGSCQKPRLAR